MKESIPQGRARRMVPLVTLTGRTAGDVIVTGLQRRIRGVERDDSAHERAADRYADLLGRSRGVLMKAGQILSFMTVADPDGESRGNIYRTALGRLQTQAPPMARDEALEVVRTELGGPIESLFAGFDPTPFAAASIGQVHRARLHDGRDVVVKVQYPGVAEAIKADLENVALLTTFIRLGGAVIPDVPRLDTRALAEEIRSRIGEEIDYVTEAANQQEFADLYRGHPFIHIPEIVTELSTSRVLTMEYADGLGWEDAIKAPRELRDQWGEVIQRFVWGGFRRNGVTHTDPHPGNFIFHEDGSITFLDFGSVKRFSGEQVRGITRLERSVASDNADGVFRACVELELLQDPDSVSPQALLAWLSDLFLPMTAEQPHTYTPEFAFQAGQALLSPMGPHSAVIRQLGLPPDFTFFLRMDAGVSAIMAGLRACGPWRAMAEEQDAVGPPSTPRGVLEAEFFGTSPRLMDVIA